MYDDYDYDDAYLDSIDDELESYNDEIEGYDMDLDGLDDDEFIIQDSYEEQLYEIDEYWDRENEYIKTSGIYTEEEVEQILANHEEIRRSKKEEAKAGYEMEMENLKWEREQLLFDKESAESDRDNLQFERELAEIENKNTFPEVGYKESPVASRKPSFMQRAFTAAAVYHFFKKLF